LAAQHLTSVRAAAALCAAHLENDALGAMDLTFAPQREVRPDAYRFDVGAARPGGSAGAAALVLQTVLLPLCLAEGHSEVVVEGGTHNPNSPPFDYVRDIWLEMLARMGVETQVTLEAWGWFPIGRGVIRAAVAGHKRRLSPLDLRERGALRAIRGRAVAANLPDHIPARMKERAHSLLSHLPCELDLHAENVQAACAGAGIFLDAVYENCIAGFSAIGRRGRSSEEVAEEAALGLVSHHAARAALDSHLGDQLLAPAALAGGRSSYSVHRVTRHLRTNAWVIEQFGLAEIAIEERLDGTGLVTVAPTA
jgi:RNA 3'-terminal phosphate cyclase (ATP)